MWEVYIDLVEQGITVYQNLGRTVHEIKRRPTYIDEYTWMCDIDNRANSHLANRRIFWMYQPMTNLVAQIFRVRAGNDVIICQTPLVYGVAKQSMTDAETHSVYDFIRGLVQIYEVMREPLTGRTRMATYLDGATNMLYQGARRMPLDRFGLDGLRENRMTTLNGGGEFNFRRAIETCELASPFGRCFLLWAYELNYALQQRWSYRSIASDVVGPFLYTMLIPPEQLPPNQTPQRSRWDR